MRIPSNTSIRFFSGGGAERKFNQSLPFFLINIMSDNSLKMIILLKNSSSREIISASGSIVLRLSY